MKKLYILSLALASITSFASCNQNQGGGGQRIGKEEFESAIKNEGIQYLQLEFITTPVTSPGSFSKAENYNEVVNPISHTKISPTRYSEITESQVYPDDYREEFIIKNENDDHYTGALREERGGEFGTKFQVGTKPTPHDNSAYEMIGSCSEEFGTEPFLPTYKDFTYKKGKYTCTHVFYVAPSSISVKFSISIKDKKVSCLEVEYFDKDSLSNSNIINMVMNFTCNYTYDEVEVPIPDRWDENSLL